MNWRQAANADCGRWVCYATKSVPTRQRSTLLQFAREDQRPFPFPAQQRSFNILMGGAGDAIQHQQWILCGLSVHLKAGRSLTGTEGT
jgi:hypothetical protein